MLYFSTYTWTVQNCVHFEWVFELKNYCWMYLLLWTGRRTYMVMFVQNWKQQPKICRIVCDNRWRNPDNHYFLLIEFFPFTWITHGRTHSTSKLIQCNNHSCFVEIDFFLGFLKIQSLVPENYGFQIWFGLL